MLEEINLVRQHVKNLQERTVTLKIIFDYDIKQERLEELKRELEEGNLWTDPTRAQTLGRERAQLEDLTNSLHTLSVSLSDIAELIELAIADNDEVTLNALKKDIEAHEKTISALEFKRMFSEPMDPNGAYLEIQSGSGGTEAQDWAEMLLRMYLRFAEQHGFQTEIVEVSSGEVAGIKSATLHIQGDHAFGWLRTETGVHRLVRKSPFDSGNRRHTSFASVFVSPEIDDEIEVDINMADVRVDTYRASGAGGQHVNRTDSAVRLTHLPTGIVVQCQSDRSQHKNKASAIKQLRAKLYELEYQKRFSEQQALEDSKSDIGWGHQIRSYVLDASRIKDLRTGVETGNTQAVLDGALDQFIEASLKWGIENKSK